MRIFDEIPFFCGVYAIRNRRSGAMYVGCTKQLDFRWRSHLYALRAGKHDQPLLQAAWATDGVDAFELVLLEAVDAADIWALRDALRDTERRWLLDLVAKGVPLYNKTLPQSSIAIVDETL